jgi:hypothetical protein
MTDYKAIRYIEYHGHIDDEVKDIAIKAIKELHKYKAIGTIEEFKDLKEKNVAKKPIQQETTEKTHYKCPFCNNIMQTIYRDGVGWGHIADYCEWCGQKIDMD